MDNDCGCKGEPATTEVVGAVRAELAQARAEARAGVLSELLGLLRDAMPVRSVPSDRVGIATRRVQTGSVFTVPMSLDRAGVRIDGYATDAGAGVLEAVVGEVGRTLGADNASGEGIPLIFTEADGRPVPHIDLATRSALEVRVVRCQGTGVITVTQLLAEGT